MAKFREHHDDGFLAHARVPREDGARFWQWAANISRWLDDTSHISIRYGIRYDGVDIEQLSPGTAASCCCSSTSRSTKATIGH